MIEAPMLVITPGPPCRRIGATKHLVQTLLTLAGGNTKEVRTAGLAPFVFLCSMRVPICLGTLRPAFGMA